MFLLLLVSTLIGSSESTGIAAEVKAHVGTVVALPCRVDTPTCGELHSVKWYRESSRIYVFSQVGGGIARAEGDATERMTVEYEKPHTEAMLKISPVDVKDEANYKCEITYLDVSENCDVVQIIRLTTLVKPESVRILRANGEPMGNATILGPHDEGTQMELTCEAVGGKPIPKVSWYNGSKPLNSREQYSRHELEDGIGTGTSKLSFELSRGDLGARFECRVDSEALDEPIVSWMTADVNVKPTKIELSGVKGYVVAGSNVMLICDVYGARPAAEVKWFNVSEPITDQKYIQTVPEHVRDGTFTTKSTLVFQASRFENGNAFHCYADNSVILDQKEPSLHEVLLIEVYYAPVVTVSPANITTNEGVDILLLCSYVSNPMKLDGVIWSKNGKNLTLDPEKYDGGNVDNPPLVIKNVSRVDMGEYTCTCKNAVGSQESEESVWLNVMYTPSTELSMDPPTPVKEKDQVNVTLLCSVTSGNPSTLTKVRWYLGGELMKELPDCNYTSYNEDGEGEGSGGQLCGIDPSLIGLWNVGQGMAGNYTCQGKNDAGWGPESDPVELIVYYSPGPARLTYTPSKVIKTASVTLDCTVSHPGRPENVSYLWYRGTYQVPEITTSKWTISPVLLETKSNFTCIAVNEGGQSDPSTAFIDVKAPPAFIQNLPPYQGILMNAKNISLTCRVECSPTCSITWYKDGRLIDKHNTHLYDIRTKALPPDLRKNDFESVESTLVWNMSAWPNEMLDRTAPNSNYTCQSSKNSIGLGVNSTTEIAVDYPPENLTVSKQVVYVVEHHKPDKVTCSGKGHPNLNYAWRREGDAEYLPKKTDVLELGALTRLDSGNYICEASNKHGNASINVYVHVRFAPSCTIEQVEYEGSHALECTARANPQEVTFSWKVKGDNDTVDGSSLVQKGLKGYLLLDTSVDSYRTYQCFVNNSVGMSVPCERDVTGVAPWWRHFISENLVIFIAAIVAIIICVIIICIIIIIVCRRKRANNKYTNAVEMEEREKPDGQSPDTSGTKWPLKPGVLLHVNKMHSLNMSQLSPMSINAKQYKTTSVRARQHKNRLYSRLKRFKELLGFGDRDSLPFGVYRGSAGVVTFKKFKDTSSPVQTERAAVSRKRKKPGLLPNQSSTADKGGLGAAPPGGGSADPLTDPDKGFYENLPFHGMQNPPNKPISIISPIIQGNPSYSSTKSLISGGTNFSPYNTVNHKKVQRNQSFHGFQTYGMYPNPFNQWPQFHPHVLSHPNLQFIPTIFYNLPRSFSQHTGSHTVGAIRTNPQINPFNYYNRVQSFNNFNPFNQTTRVVGRSEHKLDIRRTASGINLPTAEKDAIKLKEKNKRFNSLEIKKHKCYSPTFYSMRCKKHAKKRPIIYTLPMRPKNVKTENAINNITEQYQDLTDSIQIFEQNADNSNVEDSTPKPAPRCSKHKELIYANVSKSIQKTLDDSQNSNNSSENCEAEVSVIEAVVHEKLPKVNNVVHKNSSTPIKNSADQTNLTIKDKSHPIQDKVRYLHKNDDPSEEVKSLHHNDDHSFFNYNGDPIFNSPSDKVKFLHNNVNSPNFSVKDQTTSPNFTVKDGLHKNVASLKVTKDKASIDATTPNFPVKDGLHQTVASLKLTPTVKVSPNFIKPKVESPKGALQTQLHAKIKASQKAAEGNLTMNSCTLVQKALSQTSLNRSNTSLDKLDVVDGHELRKLVTEIEAEHEFSKNNKMPKLDGLDQLNGVQRNNQSLREAKSLEDLRNVGNNQSTKSSTGNNQYSREAKISGDLNNAGKSSTVAKSSAGNNHWSTEVLEASTGGNNQWLDASTNPSDNLNTAGDHQWSHGSTEASEDNPGGNNQWTTNPSSNLNTAGNNQWSHGSTEASIGNPGGNIQWSTKPSNNLNTAENNQWPHGSTEVPEDNPGGNKKWLQVSTKTTDNTGDNQWLQASTDDSNNAVGSQWSKTSEVKPAGINASTNFDLNQLVSNPSTETPESFKTQQLTNSEGSTTKPTRTKFNFSKLDFQTPKPFTLTFESKPKSALAFESKPKSSLAFDSKPNSALAHDSKPKSAKNMFSPTTKSPDETEECARLTNNYANNSTGELPNSNSKIARGNGTISSERESRLENIPTPVKPFNRTSFERSSFIQKSPKITPHNFDKRTSSTKSPRGETSNVQLFSGGQVNPFSPAAIAHFSNTQKAISDSNPFNCTNNPFNYTQQKPVTPIKPNFASTPCSNQINMARSNVDANKPNVDLTSSRTSQPNIDFTPSKISKPNLDSTLSKTSQPNVHFTPSRTSNPNIDFSPSKTSHSNVDFAPSKSNQPNVDSILSETSQPNVHFTPLKTSKPNIFLSPSKTNQPNVDYTHSKTNQPSVDSTLSKTNQPNVHFTPSQTSKPNFDFSPSKSNQPNVDFTPSKTNLSNVGSTPTKTNLSNVGPTPTKTSQPNINFTPSKTNKPNFDFSPSKTNQPNVDFTPSKTNLSNVGSTPTKTSQPNVNFTPSKTSKPIFDFSPSKTNQPNVDYTPSKPNQPSFDCSLSKTTQPNVHSTPTKTNQPNATKPTSTSKPNIIFSTSKPNITDFTPSNPFSGTNPVTPKKFNFSKSDTFRVNPSKSDPIKKQTEKVVVPSPKSAPPKCITQALIPVVDQIKKPVAQKIGQDTQDSGVPQMPLLDTQNKWNTINNTNKQNSFYTLTTPHLKQLTSTNMHQQYSATIPHQKHMKLIPRSLFQDQQVSKSKSFSSKSKPKKHFQIPLQKCHSFKFQTAESYFQPIKNIHEENFMRNGYISDMGPNYPENHPPRHHHKREKQKTNGPLILRRPGDYHQEENMQFQENVQNSVQLQYPQPVLGMRPNGIVYADLDMPKSNKKTSGGKEGSTASLTKSQKVKAKTEYATLQFNDVGQEIDV